MKKLVVVLLAIVLVISPIGNFVFQDSTVAEAKRYKSGKKSFNMDQNKNTNNSTIQKKKNQIKQLQTMRKNQTQ